MAANGSFCSNGENEKRGIKVEARGTSPHWLSRNGGVGTMAMPQRDDTIEAIKRLDALLEYAVMHGDEAEAERLREELRKLTDEV